MERKERNAMEDKKQAQHSSSDGFDPIKFTQHDARTSAMLSKTIPNNRVSYTRDELGNRKTLLPQTYTFKNKLQKRAKRNSDAKMVLKLLPDIELSIQILTSSILSPADMMSADLNYVGPKNVFTSELTGTLIARLKEYFEESYKIKPLLPKMLRDILAEKGSYPVAVIPENVIDNFINGDIHITTESMSKFVGADGIPKNIGILGSPTDSTKARKKGFSLEDFAFVAKSADVDTRLHYAIENERGKIEYEKDEYIHVTDNLMVLKFNKLHEVVKKKRVRDTVTRATGGFSLESMSKVSDLKIENLIYKPKNLLAEQVSQLKGQAEMKRRSVGNPLIMHLPSEAVLPIHVPGSVEKQIGYFVLLDEEGNPIESVSDDQYYNNVNQGMNSASKNSLSSNIISRINTNIGGNNAFDPNNSTHLDYASQVYADMVERDLIARIKNGIHSSSVQIAKNEEIYRVMLSRALSRKFTQILYIPIDYMTYMAFKYDEDGIGKSLLDDASTINTLRSVLMFSDVIASIKNSIGRTQVNMEIPEDDPNPMKTIEMAQDEIVRSRQLGIPLGITNPTDITDFIQRAGYEWAFTGHSGLPNLKFEFQNNASSIARPDTELQESLKKHSIMVMGLSPETVDNGFSGEFATTVVANNILLSKRVMQYQELFSPSVSDHLRKVATHSEELVLSLRDIIEENSKQIKYTIDETVEQSYSQLSEENQQTLLINRSLSIFLNQFQVELPKPPSVTLENQLSDLNTYIQALDVAIDAYINDAMMTDTTSGEMSGQVETIKAMIKSHFIRKWLADKGVLTELSELVATGEDGSPQLNLMKETSNHLQSMIRSCVNTIASLKPIAAAATADLQEMGAEEEEGGSDMTSDDSSGDESSSGLEEEAPDFDLGDTAEDEPSAEEEPEEEEPEPQPDL